MKRLLLLLLLLLFVVFSALFAENNGNVDFFSTSIVIEEEALPTVTALHSAFPNPFNSTTIISFSVSVGDTAELEIFNILGQKVKTYPHNFEGGDHTVVWNGKDKNGKEIGSGVYFYKLRTNSFVNVKKMLLLK
jgi:flagellar hook assembly protein FlgD